MCIRDSGYVFLRRGNGSVQGLSPRGLPVGVQGGQIYQEGVLQFEPGDTLVLFSDGVIDASPELELTSTILAGELAGAISSQEMVDRLINITGRPDPQPDDITVVVLRCTG
jgi:serine phosphatase RsbU (regulator of sigma subunit)